MKVVLKEIHGPWNQGWVLDKHTIESVCVGHDEYGHPRFQTKRTEVGEATYQLKYRNDWSQVRPLAKAITDNIFPKLNWVGFIVPMPASKKRDRQPVSEIAHEVGMLMQLPVFDNVLIKAGNGSLLKDLQTKEEKLKAIGNSISLNDEIDGEGSWNVLLIDDLYHTGASMETACKVLRTYSKVKNIYVVALTWR